MMQGARAAWALVGSGCVVVSLAALAACDKGKGATKETAPVSRAPTTAASGAEVDNTVPAPSAITPYTPPSATPDSYLALGERFAKEASSRPTGIVTADQVIDAWKAAGVTLREQRQHLGTPFHASYCVGAKLGKDVHTSLCEYKTEAVAREGVEISGKAINIPNRKVYRNGQTMLVVRVGDPSVAEDAALAAKLADTFKAQKPAPAAAQPPAAAAAPAKK